MEYPKPPGNILNTTLLACNPRSMYVLHLISWSDDLGLDATIRSRAVRAKPCHGVDVGLPS